MAAGREAPSEKSLRRLLAAAQLAWDNQVPIHVGFRVTKTGVRIAAKQRRQRGNLIDLEGPDGERVAEMMETCLIKMAALTTGLTEDALRLLVDRAVDPSPAEGPYR